MLITVREIITVVRQLLLLLSIILDQIYSNNKDNGNGSNNNNDNIIMIVMIIITNNEYDYYYDNGNNIYINTIYILMTSNMSSINLINDNCKIGNNNHYQIKDQRYHQDLHTKLPSKTKEI